MVTCKHQGKKKKKKCKIEKITLFYKKLKLSSIKSGWKFLTIFPLI
jgi:hypothetical protein